MSAIGPQLSQIHLSSLARIIALLWRCALVGCNSLHSLSGIMIFGKSFFFSNRRLLLVKCIYRCGGDWRSLMGTQDDGEKHIIRSCGAASRLSSVWGREGQIQCHKRTLTQFWSVCAGWYCGPPLTESLFSSATLMWQLKAEMEISLWLMKQINGFRTNLHARNRNDTNSQLALIFTLTHLQANSFVFRSKHKPKKIYLV